MGRKLDKDFWESHWNESDGSEASEEAAPNPHLVREVEGLKPGTALDAGCGEGAEAIWLATRGWQVTGADISTAALSRAAERSEAAGVSVEWVEADLGVWEPGVRFDLVTTHYAHPDMPQLDFYTRIADWVAPGGSLLVVGHLQEGAAHEHGSGRHGHGPSGNGSSDHGDGPFKEASVTVASVTALLDESTWDVVTAEEQDRAFRGMQLRDAIVRAVRR